MQFARGVFGRDATHQKPTDFLNPICAHLRDLWFDDFFTTEKTPMSVLAAFGSA